MNFSIVMPCYNAELYIRRAIRSVLQQSYLDFELIIIDDGSTDNSLAIIEQFLAEDCRLKLVKVK
ncbi:glycosyltransferase family 2 protein [bacterium]|nr:glycosyltransferase family 2 protein [bacterium]